MNLPVFYVERAWYRRPLRAPCAPAIRALAVGQGRVEPSVPHSILCLLLLAWPALLTGESSEASLQEVWIVLLHGTIALAVRHGMLLLVAAKLHGRSLLCLSALLHLWCHQVGVKILMCLSRRKVWEERHACTLGKQLVWLEVLPDGLRQIRRVSRHKIEVRRGRRYRK